MDAVWVRDPWSPAGGNATVRGGGLPISVQPIHSWLARFLAVQLLILGLICPFIYDLLILIWLVKKSVIFAFKK